MSSLCIRYNIIKYLFTIKDCGIENGKKWEDVYVVDGSSRIK